MPYVTITKALVNASSKPGVYRDTKLPGFVLRIRNSGKKFYSVMRKVKGSQTNITVTVGACEVISCEKARVKAKDIIAQMSAGLNPNDKIKQAKETNKLARRLHKEQKRVEAITLRKVTGDYFRTRQLKESTEYIYGLLVNRYLGDWLDLPITAISKDMVAKRHAALSEHKAQANHIMRILRALLSYAAAAYEDEDGKALIVENPVRRLSQTKAWHRVSRRQSVIKAHQLKSWYAAVASLEEEPVRDYLMVLLLTGLRKNEAAKLTWRDVDLKANTLLIKDTKNHEDHMLPLPDYLRSLLLKRWRDKGSNNFVFYTDNKRKHVYDCRHSLRQVEEMSGVKFMLHDLRRTFLTIAEELDTPHYALKKLANHKVSADVTAGYIVSDVERLRQPLEKIDVELLRRCGIKTKNYRQQPRKQQSAK